MEFKASKKVVIDSMMMIVFGVFVIIMPYLMGGQKGTDKISAAVGLIVIAFGAYFYYKTRRLKVVIHNDRIEYVGQTKNEDRTVYFHDIYLLETIKHGGVLKTFIVDKYKDGNRVIVRGTNPPATEKEIGRGKDIKLNYKESISLESRKIENYEKLVYEISKRISRDRVGHESENVARQYTGEKIPDKTSELSKEEMKRLNRIRITFKTIMLLNVFSLLVISVIVEGKSPIINNKNTMVFLTLIILYIINLILNLSFIIRSSMVKDASTKSIKALSYTGIGLSLCVIIPLVMKMFK